MDSANCAYPAATGIFDELPWMSMPPAAYYAYPVSAGGQAGYPMAMQHSLPYSNMANWYGYNASGMQSGGKYKKKRNLFTKLQLNMLQRRFAEKEHIRQPERDNFAQMIGLTGEQVKIWFQNQRYKRKHRESGKRNEIVSGSSGANTSVSSLSSPSPGDSSDSENVKRNE
ncbi:homeobox domain protein [Teladorsagia circumcincta]|uniref:Homeobox domain protein n=1 Tax=Teladorsagia circumcincta TaxID=45464 RepID=A0A2G9UK95_TELCI|nr:homeobox domain protein [Teladorsagia circumcincta]